MMCNYTIMYLILPPFSPPPLHPSTRPPVSLMARVVVALTQRTHSSLQLSQLKQLCVQERYPWECGLACQAAGEGSHFFSNSYSMSSYTRRLLRASPSDIWDEIEGIYLASTFDEVCACVCACACVQQLCVTFLSVLCVCVCVLVPVYVHSCGLYCYVVMDLYCHLLPRLLIFIFTTSSTRSCRLVEEPCQFSPLLPPPHLPSHFTPSLFLLSLLHFCHISLGRVPFQNCSERCSIF